MSSDEIRTLEQNKKFHAQLADIAAQVEWAGMRMGEESWKRLVLGAAHGQVAVPNPFDHSAPPVVVNVKRSSQLHKPDMADLILQLEIFGDERGVRWSNESHG